MKYSILGFNQAEVVKYEVVTLEDSKPLKCDLTDLTILNYIIYAQANPKMKHIADDDGQSYVWLQHKHILEDLPILNITEGTLKNRLTKLRKMNLISSKTIASENQQGTKTFYATTSFCYDLLFDTTSFKNDVLDRPRHSKMTSNTFTNIDNKVNTVVSKDTTRDFSFGSKQSTTKKENLYTKCVHLIDSKTTNLKTRELLIQWLNMLLEKYKSRGKQLYFNVFKGKLNMLDKFEESRWDEVIEFNIQRGYEGFYPPTSNYSSSVKDKPWERGVKSDSYTEEEKRQIEKERAEMEARGEQVWF